MATPREYCAESSQRHGEPMAGSADTVTAWLMLEHRPAWSARPLEDGSVGDSTRSALGLVVQRLKAAGFRPRVQLIRQPARQDGGRQLFLQLARQGRCELFGFAGDADEPPRLDVARLLEDPAVFAAHRLAGPHYFVCTNGQRDLCCARFGLPVYDVLAERLGERVWQTTHVGGHRFAPNVLVLPSGALYGRVTLDALPSFIDTTERGGIATEHLRGRSWREPAVQAAEIHLQRETGQLPDDADVSVDTEGRGDAQSDPSVSTRCRVSFPSAGWEVDLVATTHQLLTSCGDTTAKPVQTWALVVCRRRA